MIARKNSSLLPSIQPLLRFGISLFILMIPVFAQDLPETIFDSSVGNWIIDRFAGNSKAGLTFYQGAARESGGMQVPGNASRPLP